MTLDPWQKIGDLTRFVPAWLAVLRTSVGHRQEIVPSTARVQFELPSPHDAIATPDDARAVLPAIAASQKQPTFRASAAGVLVDVSVFSGDTPVEGLTAADFELRDNGVPQHIQDVSREPLPLDVTMVLDFYDAATESNAYVVQQKRQLQQDLVHIAALLRPADRLRLITVENEPAEVRPLGPPGGPLHEEPDDKIIGRLSYGRSSAIYDAIAAALMRLTPMGRRHLVLTFTEGVDDASILTQERLLAISKAADAVMHLSKRKTALEVAQEGLKGRPFGSMQYRSLLWPQEPRVVIEAARNTGGTVLDSLGGAMYDEIQAIIDRLRQSYLLRYQPTGVDSGGWHEISVRVVRRGRYDVEARKGYFGG